MSGDVRAVLARSPLTGPWKVARAQEGWSGRSFVADNGAQQLFVKFDVAVDMLRRLANIGVAPPVLHAGEYRSHPYVIQPFLAGRSPCKEWFEGHLPELARLVGAYHLDVQLRTLISPMSAVTHQEHISELLVDLERRSRVGPADAPRPYFTRALARLRQQSRDLRPSPLVATHGDPNTKNFIVTDDLKVYLLDWDDLRLADQFRDVGQLLWWYVDPGRWSEFLDQLGIDWDGDAQRSLYWWVAAESLDVALSSAARGDDEHAAAFLDDFSAAIARRPNPHARYKEQA